MVQKSEKFFIFSWKELMVIALLAVISVGFFFTLGLHYGKKINLGSAQPEQPIGKIEQGPETLPNREVLEQASRHALVATEDSIKSATQEELQQGGVKLEAPKQVDLPQNKVNSKAAKAEVKAPAPVEKESVAEEKAKPAPEAPKKGKFSIQLGSFPNHSEAAAQLKLYGKRGLHGEIKTAVVRGSTRYRIVLPGFANKHGAEDKAKDLKQKKKIDSFVIIKSE